MTTLLLRVRGWWEDLQDSLWLMPALAVCLAVGLASLLMRVDPPPAWMPEVFRFGGGADSARNLLSQLAGSTFTVVGVVFSLTAVALQMASSQFTPRLLRNFLKDRSVQLVLSGFIGSGVFHVAVLRRVRSGDDNGPAFIPEIAVTASLFAALLAVALLVYFLHHLMSQLRVDVVMAAIRRETLRQLDALPTDRSELPDELAPPPPDDALVVTANVDGYLQQVDLLALAKAARANGVAVRLRPVAGEWVGKGTTVAWVWRPDGRAPVADEASRIVHRSIHLGGDRTESGDLAYGLRQLEDIAGRAMSTGVNDPTTAVQALGQLAAILTRMAHHPLGADTIRDPDGTLRAAAPRPTFAAHLELAVGQIRRYGRSELPVLLAIMHLLTDVAEQVADHGDRASVVRAQVERTMQLAELEDPEERDRLDDAATLARRTLELGHRPAGEAAAG